MFRPHYSLLFSVAFSLGFAGSIDFAQAGVTSATRLDSDAAILTWKQAKDNLTPTERLRYLVYYSSDPDQVIAEGVKDVVIGTTETVVTELPAGENVYFTIRAQDEAGNTELNDFGFVPGTRGDDGDPLDVLVLMDAPAFPGCVVLCRLIGAIETEQTEKGGKSERNDRLIAVDDESRRHKDIDSLSDVSKALMTEIEHFFISYNELKGKKFKVLRQCSAEHACKLVKQGQKKYRSRTKKPK